MLFPARTGFGDPDYVTAISAWPAVATVKFAVTRLLDGFGSTVEDVTSAVSEMTTPEEVPAFTFTTTMIVAGAPTARVATEQDTVPVPPTEGALQVQPAGALTETNVVLDGTVSLSWVGPATDGPWLVTTCC